MSSLTGERPKVRGRPFRSEQPRSDLIIAAALKSFAASGYDGASMRQIAKVADVDVALLAHTFGSKFSLWMAVVDEIAARVETAMRQSSLDLPVSPGEQLRQALERLIDLVCETAYLANFTVKECADQGERFDYVYAQLIKPTHDWLLPLIDAAIRSGELPAGDPNLFFFAITGAVSMTVAARPFLIRFSPAAGNDAAFKRQLKQAVLAGARIGAPAS